MSLWVCLDCTTAYSVGALSCPQCGSERYAEDGTEESEMAKIGRHMGASNEASGEGMPTRKAKPVEAVAVEEPVPAEPDEAAEESAPEEPAEEPKPRRRRAAEAGEDA